MKLLATSMAALAVLICASSAAARVDPLAPDPAALDAARRVVATIRAEQIVDQMFSAMERPMLSAMLENLPLQKQAAAMAMQEAAMEAMHAFTPKLVDAMVVIYATDFTVAQLTDIDQFYASPTGQALLEKTPEISQQILPVMMSNVPDIMAQAFDRFCQRTVCTPDQRAALAKMLDAIRAHAPAKPG